MCKYCDHETANHKKADCNEEPLPQAPPGTREPPRFVFLANHYGLPEMGIGDLGGTQSEQTVMQEYQAYMTGQCSLTNTDTLKFWEVSHYINVVQSLLTRSGRLTSQHFPLFL